MDTQGKAVKLVNSKLAILKFSSSSTKSIGVTTRSMSKKLKDSSQITPRTEGIHEKHYTKKDKSAKELRISCDGLIPVDQLKEFIEGTIKSKIEGSSKSSLTYSKPYTPRIDSLKMPMGYQPPKFQQFYGKGNPKQHVAHFVETCNNEGTYGDHWSSSSSNRYKAMHFAGILIWRLA
ncbi:UNVERIFIED_CONTAM: hypothetical protein Slati_3694600 [Sesamum latifolium]|uniref:Ty3-gypsy retrotransposon protein n=1 Tax=Sesamum latifolium TaxID=2727402 RepID=A0AAW2U2J1_9LAMI